MTDPIILKMKNDKNEIQKIHDFFNQKAKKISLSQDTVDAIAVSLEEILLNIMEHGYGESVDLSIHVAIFFRGPQIKIKIQDTSKRFNPLDYKKVNLQQYFEKQTSGEGLGIHLVREMMDEIIYQRKNGKNILIMKKNYEIDTDGNNK